MVLKILGAVLAIWIAFILLGLVFKVLTVMLVAGAVLFVGAAGYAALKGGKQGQIGR